MQFVSTPAGHIRDLSQVFVRLMTLNVLSAVADDSANVDIRIKSLCVSGSEAFETGFVFNTSCIVEIAVTFLMTGADSSFSSMLYKLIWT